MQNSGPLSGLRVLNIGGIGPAPFTAMLLADLGADVVSIERAGGPVIADRGRSDDGIDILGRGARRVVLDLKTADGVASARELADRADVVIEGFRPGVTERLGLGPEQLHDSNPRLIYARVTGYGQDGPLAQRAGHDINYIAQVGLLHAIGRAGGPPQVPLNLVGDYGGGGMLAAFGICAALWERERSGVGQVVDAAMVDGVSLLMSALLEKRANGHWSDERGTNPLDTGAATYDVYETSDAEWMAVGSREPQFRARLLQVLRTRSVEWQRGRAARDPRRTLRYADAIGVDRGVRRHRCVRYARAVFGAGRHRSGAPGARDVPNAWRTCRARRGTSLLADTCRREHESGRGRRGCHRALALTSVGALALNSVGALALNTLGISTLLEAAQ